MQRIFPNGRGTRCGRTAFLALLALLCAACTDRTVRIPSVADLLIEITVQDMNREPAVTVRCTNLNARTVSIARSAVTSGCMPESFFSIREQFSRTEESGRAVFTGGGSPAPDGHIQLAPGKSVSATYALADFYEFPAGLCTSLYVSYDGPLGTSPQRILSLSSEPYKHYGTTAVELSRQDGRVTAALRFTNTSGRALFLPAAAFADDGHLSDDFFAVGGTLPDGTAWQAPFLGTAHGLPLPLTVGDCVAIPAGGTYVHTLTLSDWYAIPPEAIALTATYYGYCSPPAQAALP